MHYKMKKTELISATKTIKSETSTYAKQQREINSKQMSELIFSTKTFKIVFIFFLNQTIELKCL